MTLKRDVKNAMCAGVCAGLGKYFGVDALFFRLAFLLMFFGAGTGPLLYLILWLLVPADNGEN